MSAYLKLTYHTQAHTAALTRGLVYIGRNYGGLRGREGQTDRACLKAGIAYIAGKLGRNRKNAVRAMIAPEGRGQSGQYCWKIHKQIFPKAFGEIVRLLAACPGADAHHIYTDLMGINVYWGGDCYSDYLIPAQKTVLLAAAADTNRDTAAQAVKLLRRINLADAQIPQL